jgi:hypothetical protein
MLAAVAAGVAVAAGGGAAIAASQADSASPSAFFDAVAKHLGISSEELQDATKAAAIDQVNAALADGKITEEQADRLKERIESGELPPFFGFGLFPGLHGHMHMVGGQLDAAADYLGLGDDELREKLHDGKTLAQIAEEEGKSVDGLKQAMLTEAKTQLDDAVEEGDLTRAEADRIYARMQARIDDIVNGNVERWRAGRVFRGHPPGGPFWAPGG